MRRVFLIIGLLVSFVPLQTFAATSLAENATQTIRIYCGNDADGVTALGSGIIISDSLVLTNAHVVTDNGYYHEWCVGAPTRNIYTAPEIAFWLRPTDLAQYNATFDYAFMEAWNDNGTPYIFPSSANFSNSDGMTAGDAVTLMGYPGSGGSTITVTTGNIAGFIGTTHIKTDALADAGNSGGAAFDASGNLFGLVTAVTTGTYRSGYTIVQNINAILENAFGTNNVIRDYATLYSRENIVCVLDSCYRSAFGDDTDAASTPETPASALAGGSGSYNVPEHAEYRSSEYDAVMYSRVKGRILLQVEQHGEAWYVNPDDGLRYYMRDGAIAYQMMRSFSLGISDADLAGIPSVDAVEDMAGATSICATNVLANRLKGEILLQVEQHGEAWYVHPDTCRRIYMKDGDVAYGIMRYLSLGISDNDLATLPYASTMEVK